ncbi:hypothetical protein ACJ41O_002532 [Fusarium nematophilum]
MAADEESNYSSNQDIDPGLIAMQAQQRVIQLKKDRDDLLDDVVSDSAAAMDDLRKRVVSYQHKRRTKETNAHAISVLKIAQSVERRRDIEECMVAIVSKVNSRAQQVEEMMKIGFRAREKGVKKTR